MLAKIDYDFFGINFGNFCLQKRISLGILKIGLCGDPNSAVYLRYMIPFSIHFSVELYILFIYNKTELIFWLHR